MSINLKVIDLSHHNTLDDDAFKQMFDSGIRGVILKSSQGTNYKDPTYDDRRQDALDAGLLVGAYHFATGEDIDAQIEHFFAAAAPDEKTLMALDHEPNKGNQLDLDGCRDFLQKGEAKLGRKLVLYSGNLIKEQLDEADEYICSHRLWLAQYGDRIKLPTGFQAVWLHQFSGDGVNSHGLKPPGIHGLVDMNSYAGTDEQLAAEWA